jgi:hypothetical protein
MKNIILCDLDGTLANIDHRLHLVKDEHPNWDEFYNSCDQDNPNEWCISLLNALHIAKDIQTILIVSARRASLKRKSVRWINRLLPWFDGRSLVLVRPDGNHEEDQELKRRWLHESGLKDRVLFVIDDRSKVCSMWREEGLVCLQCADWKEYKNEKSK